MKTKQLLFFFFLTVGFQAVFSQKASVEGVIKLKNTSEQVFGISVYLDKTNYGTTTDTKGSYLLKEIPPGKYVLIASLIGYQSIRKPIDLKPGVHLKINLVLQESVSDLPEIVIITGGDKGIKEIPGSAYYISPKEIEKFNYTDIDRVLRVVPGVNIQEEDGFGLFPNIGMRGTGTERSSKITVMEDGVLAAPAPYAAPSAYYFPTTGRMQGIEIIKGSSQIKYGPYTTGGAINLISTQIPNRFTGKLNLTAGSFGTKDLHVVIGNKHERVSYLLETFQFMSNGFKTIEVPENRGFDVNSGFYKQDYIGKIRLNTDVDAKVYQSLSFKFGRVTADINETYLGLTQDDFKERPFSRYAGSQVDHIKTKQSQYTLTHYAKFSNAIDVSTVIYKTNFDRNWYKLDKLKNASGEKIKIVELLDYPEKYPELYEVVKGKTSVNDDALFVKANNRSYYGKGIQTLIRFNFDSNEWTHKLDVGLRLHQDQIDRFQWVDTYRMDSGVMALTEAGEHGTESNRVETANAFASYVQYELKYRKLTLIPGIRYENIFSERKDYGKEDPNRTGKDLTVRSNAVSVFIPGIGIDYRFTESMSSFAGIHKGFAPPGSKEGVKPEESINYELGFRFSKNGFSGQSVFFLNDYDNLLGTDLEAGGGNGTNDQFNGGAVKSRGIEFNATYDLFYPLEISRFSLPVSLVYTYTKANFQTTFDSDFEGWGDVENGDDIPYLPHHQFTLLLSLEHEKFAVNLNGKYQGEVRTAPGQGAIPENEKISSSFIIDAGADYFLSKQLSFFVTATNIFDSVYLVARRPAGLRPGMPRAFNFGVKTNF